MISVIAECWFEYDKNISSLPKEQVSSESEQMYHNLITQIMFILKHAIYCPESKAVRQLGISTMFIMFEKLHRNRNGYAIMVLDQLMVQLVNWFPNFEFRQLYLDNFKTILNADSKLPIQ